MGSKRASGKPKLTKRLQRRVAARPVKQTSASEKLRLARAETAEALAREAATAEILKVISGSPADVQPVFDAVVESAARLCDAQHASVYRVEGHALRHVAAAGTVRGRTAIGGLSPIDRGAAPGRTVLSRDVIHISDARTDTEMSPEVEAFVMRTGVRTVLGVPLMREGEAIGAILIRRTEVRPFSEKQIGLLKTFADQAEIGRASCRERV